MRRLSQQAGKKQFWREHQQAQLDQTRVTDLKVAFPGSLLCNHILVPACCEVPVDDVEFALPDVSHVVYEYCDGKSRRALFENALVVDIDGEMEGESIVTMIAECLKDEGVSRIVILGKAAYLRYAEAIRLNVGGSTEVQVFEPDWLSSFELHSIYRQATTVVFVNSMRVLDAACTGCVSRLVADREFQLETAFPVLYRYLQSTNCMVYDETGRSVTDVGLQKSLAYVLVENSNHAVQKAVGKNTIADDDRLNTEEDWFVDLNVEAPVPVIKPYRSSKEKTLSGLLDRKTGAARKVVKFWNDPRAFFLDSRYRTLRFIGRIFQNKTVDI